jgi:predicted GNAT family acetyltransferase
LFENNNVARKLYESIGFVTNGYAFEDENDMELSI